MQEISHKVNKKQNQKKRLIRNRILHRHKKLKKNRSVKNRTKVTMFRFYNKKIRNLKLQLRRHLLTKLKKSLRLKLQRR